MMRTIVAILALKFLLLFVVPAVGLVILLAFSNAEENREFVADLLENPGVTDVLAYRMWSEGNTRCTFSVIRIDAGLADAIRDDGRNALRRMRGYPLGNSTGRGHHTGSLNGWMPTPLAPADGPRDRNNALHCVYELPGNLGPDFRNALAAEGSWSKVSESGGDTHMTIIDPGRRIYATFREGD